jgi:threonine/homoserine/homoserine lactone efflux protein
MPDGAHWTLFLAATTILLVIPGPSVLFVVARGVDQGFRAALCSSIGASLWEISFKSYAPLEDFRCCCRLRSLSLRC